MTQRNKTYFLSDLHLGARYLNNPLDYERKVVRWLNSIKDSAKAIYLLGDILDFWFEYRHVAPKGFTRFLGTLALMADEGIEIRWYIGNHDIWIFDYLPKEIGMTVVKDRYEVREIDGHRFLLAHGDGVGKLKPGFSFIRSLFHNPMCQKMATWIHPRWTLPFGLNWSSHSRKKEAYEPHFLGEDKEPFILFSKWWMKNNANTPIDYFIFGHRHIVLDHKLNESSRLIILGDWINHFSYAVFDGTNLSLDYFNE